MTVPAIPADGFHILPITSIKESPLNPRKHFDQAALQELAASIREHGIITPLLARPVQDGAAELAAGHRRFRAAGLAGLTELPVVLKKMTDQQFMEVMTLENLQREDVHPLEEAEGYDALIDKYGYTAQKLAERVGRSESYIAKRLALLNLIIELRKYYLEGKIELGHATLLARLEPSGQKRVLEEGALFQSVRRSAPEANGRFEHDDVAVSVVELRRFIESDVMLDLSCAAWDKDDPILVKKAGACAACPKRTGANLALWDDTKKGDCCLDPKCYLTKSEACIKAAHKRAAAAGTKLVEISTSYSNRVDGALGPGGYVRIVAEGKKPRPCQHKEKAVIVSGPQRGWEVEICRTKSCPVHFSNRAYGAAPARSEKTFAEAWKDRRDALKMKIEAEKRSAVFSALYKHANSELSYEDLQLIAEKLIDRAGHDGSTAICKVLGVVVVDHDPCQSLTDSMPVQSEELSSRLVALCCYQGLLGWGDGANLMHKVAERHGINCETLCERVECDLQSDFEEKFAKAKAAYDKKAMASNKGGKAEVAQGKAAKQKDTKRVAAGDLEEDDPDAELGF